MLSQRFLIRAAACAAVLTLGALPGSAAPSVPVTSWSIRDGGTVHVFTGGGQVVLRNDGPDYVYAYSPADPLSRRMLIFPRSSKVFLVRRGVQLWVQDLRPGNGLGASGTLRS